MKTLYSIAMTVMAALTVASCAAEPAQPEATAEATQALTCTPGAQACDYGCYYQGGPSSSDCIVQCAADGTRWQTITDCGWAENWPYSASCLDARPTPRCENN